MTGLEWERLGRETAYEGRVVDVYRDHVRTRHDGTTRETHYDVVHHPGAASIVALFPEGDVALLRQFRYVVGGEIWEIPAGSLHPGESYETCAARELEEEIGWRAGRLEPLATFYTTPGFSDEEMRLFLAEDLEPGATALDEDEHLRVERVPLATAIRWVGTGEVCDAKTIVGLHAARAWLEDAGRWPSGAGDV